MKTLNTKRKRKSVWKFLLKSIIICAVGITTIIVGFICLEAMIEEDLPYYMTVPDADVEQSIKMIEDGE